MKIGVGPRTVLAKTCTGCGLFLNGEWFYPVRRGGLVYLNGKCKRCIYAGMHATRAERRSRKGEHEDRERQRISLRSATRTTYEYTDREMQVLAREDLTTLEKALELGRTYFAVRTALRKFGLSHRQHRNDYPTDHQWRIVFDG